MDLEKDSGRLLIQIPADVPIFKDTVLFARQKTQKDFDPSTTMRVAPPDAEYPLPPRSKRETTDFIMGLGLIANSHDNFRYESMTPDLARDILGQLTNSGNSYGGTSSPLLSAVKAAKLERQPP